MRTLGFFLVRLVVVPLGMVLLAAPVLGLLLGVVALFRGAGLSDDASVVLGLMALSALSAVGGAFAGSLLSRER